MSAWRRIPASPDPRARSDKAESYKHPYLRSTLNTNNLNNSNCDNDMLTRSVPRLRALAVAQTRCFSVSPSLRRSPALGDIKPDNAEAFDTKQRAFRQRLAEEAEAKKRKEAEESTLILHSSQLRLLTLYQQKLLVLLHKKAERRRAL